MRVRLIDFLPWDSRFFKQRIARVRTDRLTLATAPRLLAECRSQRIDCLYFLARSGDGETLRAAEKIGFSLMDIRVTMGLDLSKSSGWTEEGIRFSLAQRSDIPALQKMAAGIYKHSRFAIDPNFPRDAAPRLFSKWVARSVAGRFDDCVWIAHAGRPLAGLISCRITQGRTGYIGLVGIAPRFQGNGVGIALIGRALAWFRDQNVPSVQVVMQGSNIAAQRLYQKCGFRSERVDLWYHKWFQPTNTHR